MRFNLFKSSGIDGSNSLTGGGGGCGGCGGCGGGAADCCIGGDGEAEDFVAFFFLLFGTVFFRSLLNGFLVFINMYRGISSSHEDSPESTDGVLSDMSEEAFAESLAESLDLFPLLPDLGRFFGCCCFCFCCCCFCWTKICVEGRGAKVPAQPLEACHRDGPLPHVSQQ